MRHVISVLVENHFGVLASVSGLFSARGFNIDSLAVGETEDPSVSRMTIVARGDDRVLDQVVKQLNRLVDVIKVFDLPEQDRITRELVIAKLKVPASLRSEVIQVVNTFRAKIVDVNARLVTVEITGTEGKVDAMLELLEPYGLVEVVRTGLLAISRNSDIEKTSNSKLKKAPKAKSKTSKKKVVKKKTAKKTVKKKSKAKKKVAKAKK